MAGEAPPNFSDYSGLAQSTVSQIVPWTKGYAGIYNIKSIDEAQGYFLQLLVPGSPNYNPKLVEQYRKRFTDNGFDVSDNQKLINAWNSVVQFSADTRSKSGTSISPWDAIDVIGAGSGKKSTGPQQSIATRIVNETRKTVDLTSPQQARGLLESTMQSLVGRNPNASEINAFRAALNELEKTNAPVSKTTGTEVTTSTGQQTIDAAGNPVDITTSAPISNTQTTTTGGISAQQSAVDYARSAKDYAEYQWLLLI